jgi:carboxylesterase
MTTSELGWDVRPGATVPVDRLIPGTGALGCLLVHGLTGTPAEMMPVAETLAGHYPLWVTRIAGHATTVRDLASTSWPQWYESACAGADALSATVPRIVVIGLSMGALLAMRLAVERPAAVAGLILLSPAVALTRRLARWFGGPLRLLGAADTRWTLLRAMLARVAFSKTGSDIADPDVRASHPGYRQVPLRALLNLMALQRLAHRDAPRVTQPVLVIHAFQDHTCPVAGAEALYARLGSRQKRLALLGQSFHVVTVDRERQRVLDEITGFVDALESGTAASR